MTSEQDAENYFDDQTLSEIAALKNSLETEIHKKEEQLKTVVRDKYRDIVEVTDTIHGMRDRLDAVESTLRHLAEFIDEFKRTVSTPELQEETVTTNRQIATVTVSRPSDENQIDNDDGDFDHGCWLVLKHIERVWDDLESQNYKECIHSLSDLENSLHNLEKLTPSDRQTSLKKFQVAAQQMRRSVVDRLTDTINNAPVDQVGLMCGDNNDVLYDFCLDGAIKMLASTFSDKMSDASLAPMIRKSTSILNSHSLTSTLHEPTDATSRRKLDEPVIADISLDLHMFLFEVCHLINKVAGCYLSRASLVKALDIAVKELCRIYHDTLSVVDALPNSIRRKRVLQLYFDLLYVRSITSIAKNIDLEKLTVPIIEEVTSEYESRLDTMELYMISSQLQMSLATVRQRNRRLFGFLAPYGWRAGYE